MKHCNASVFVDRETINLHFRVIFEIYLFKRSIVATDSSVMLREINQTDDRVTTTVGKCWMKKERRQHLYLRDSKVMDGNQSSPDLLRIVRNL